MGLIVSLIVALVVVCLALWAVDLLPLPTPPKNLIKVLVIVLAIVWIINGVHPIVWMPR
jgi:hypothetical protein